MTDTRLVDAAGNSIAMDAPPPEQKPLHIVEAESLKRDQDLANAIQELSGLCRSGFEQMEKNHEMGKAILLSEMAKIKDIQDAIGLVKQEAAETTEN